MIDNPAPAPVIWITGLSGAGKTTLAQAVTRRLRKKGSSVILIDGDIVRKLQFPTAGYSKEERLAIANQFSRLCHFIAGQGVPVVCATISMFHSVQSWNRKHIPGYFEAYIRVPLDVLSRRDAKGLYRRAREGTAHHVIGLDIPAEEPHSPDWIWDNVEDHVDFDARAANLIETICRKGIMGIS